MSAGTWVGVGGQWTEMMKLLKETSPITGQLIVFGRSYNKKERK